MKNLVITLALLTSVISQAQEPAPVEGLPSPYFIDEVHCTGINVPIIHEGWLLTKEEVEPARKVEEADLCERLFRVFGIEKYQWFSPDDLERTATLIRQSGYFLDSDLSVQKSEIKNHVHVFLKVTTGPHFTENISDEFRFYDSKGQGSPRLWDTLNVEVTDRRYAPVKTNSFGITLMGTSASKAMAADPSSLNADDQQKFSMQDAYVADLYLKNQTILSKYLVFDTSYHLDADQTYSDGHSRLNMFADADLLATKHMNMVNGTVFIGPAVILTSYTPYQIQTGNSWKGAFLPGGMIGYDYGHATGNFLKFKLAYYESQRDQSVLQLNLDLQKELHFWETYFVLSVNERDVRNAVLPQDRFPLSGADNDEVYLGLAKMFHGAETTHQVSAVFGNQSLSYSTSLPNYSVNSDFVGLRYKMVEGTWNINLAASYYFQRPY